MAPYPERTFNDWVALLVPSVHTPPEAYPDLIYSLALLGICIYTTLLKNNAAVSLIRMLLSALGLHFCIEFGWGSKYAHEHNRSTYLGMGTIGCYGIMRLLETCLSAEMGLPKPKWLTKPWTVGPDGSIKRVEQAVIEPKTTWDKFAYSFDLLTNIRGVSWFGDRVWDFAPAYVANYRPTSGLSRGAFLRMQLLSLLKQYIGIDIVDLFCKSISWDKNTQFPVTTLSPSLQVLAAISVCLNTMFYITIPYTVMSIICVSFDVSPTAWPPMFDKPWTFGSLRDFWSYKWHHIFRRVFNQISAGVLHFVPTSNPRIQRVLRWATIFVLTTSLHLFIFYTLPPRPPPYDQTPYSLTDYSTMKFFLSQPLGLLIEALLVFPITDGLSPFLRHLTRTIFAWSYLIFTARYWCDAWIGKGLYDETERPVVFSPSRGLLYGHWII